MLNLHEKRLINFNPKINLTPVYGNCKSRSITFNGTLEDNEQILACKFNKYFMNRVSAINHSIELVDEFDEIKQPINNNCRFECVHPISIEELRNTCFSMGKTAGVDNVNAQVIQDCFDVIGDNLLDLINESLQTGHVSQVWKESLVIPIQKVAGTIKSEKFRPINIR